MNYPLQMDYLAFNSVNEGFESQKLSFNGIQELLTRNDLGAELLKRYQDFKVKGYDKSWSLELQGQYSFDLAYLEILLSQQETLSNLSLIEKRNLMKEVLLKLNEGNEEIDLYGRFLRVRGVYLAYKIILSADMVAECDIKENKDSELFLKTGMLFTDTEELSNSILKCADRFAKQ
jgi:hypothetical protein